MNWDFSEIIPYCGVAPVPGQLWARWNFDPVLIAALILIAGLYAGGAARLNRNGHGLRAAEQRAFYAGWALTAAALISPLCALSVSLFAARIGQHMILLLLAAPLVAYGRPFAALCALAGSRTSVRGGAERSSLLAAVFFSLLLWFWHAPLPYSATFISSPVYWLMHLSLFGAALWLWSGLLAARREGGGMMAVAAGTLASMQMGFLGALITLAPRPLYPPHALTTLAWGLTRLEDQQLGGALMWVPGGVIFLAVAMLALRLLLNGMADAPGRTLPHHGGVALPRLGRVALPRRGGAAL